MWDVVGKECHPAGSYIFVPTSIKIKMRWLHLSRPSRRALRLELIFSLTLLLLHDFSINAGEVNTPASAKCTSGRLVYLDLGVNWANTLRLYRDLGRCSMESPRWEIYGFEAMPLMHKYIESFTNWLNGEGAKPAMVLPPAGSSADLLNFARKYGCTKAQRCLSQCKKCSKIMSTEFTICLLYIISSENRISLFILFFCV